MLKFPDILQRINRRLAVLSGALIMIIGFLSVYEVIMRGFFRKPTIWTMDISQFILIWAVFIGSGYTFQELGHVRVDIFTEHMPFKIRKIFAVLGYFFSALFVASLTYSSGRMFVNAVRMNRLTISMVQIPQWILIVSMLFGCAMMLGTLAGIVADLIGGGKKYL
jgi:TRAP-type C4-dicarboxylate transport system permease small subunit